MGGRCTKQSKKSALEIGEELLEVARKEKEDKNLKESKKCYQDAIKELTKAYEKNKVSRVIKATLSEAHCECGDIQKELNLLDKAQASYQKAQKLNYPQAQDRIRALLINNANSVPLVLISSQGQPTTSQASAQAIVLSSSVQVINFKPTDTVELAQFLVQQRSQDAHYLRYQKIALGVINEFSKNPVKSKANIQEVIALAVIENKEIHSHLLNQGIAALRDTALLQPALVKGLARIIQNTNPALLNPDDLVQILKILNERLTEIHAQAADKRFIMVYTISCLLDAMADANVKGLSREKLHQPLYKSLSGLTKDPDPRLAQQALYACQALLQVPHDESKLYGFMRRTLKVGGGILNLAAAVKNFDPNKLVQAFSDFTTAFEGVGEFIDVLSDTVEDLKKTKESLTTLHEGLEGVHKSQFSWYPALRYIDLLVKAEQFEGLKQFANSVKCKRKEAFVFGLCQTLKGIGTSNDRELGIRQKTLSFLGEIYENDKVWGGHETVNKYILNILLRFATDPEIPLRTAATELLRKLALVSDKQKLFRETVPDLKTLIPRAAKPKQGFPNDLLTVVQAKPFEELQKELANLPALVSHEIKIEEEQSMIVRIKQKLEKLRQKTLDDEDITKELAIYIPVNGANPPQVTVTFDLEKTVKAEMQTQKKAILLIGSAGSGKSTFNRFVEKELWKQYQFGGAIPLFIFLPSIAQPETRLIEEHLNSCGFNDEEIQFLKEEHRFNFILDAWDELKPEQRHNLYKSNHLLSWNASTLISCRTESLPSGNYKDMFTPYEQGRPMYQLLTEMTVVPFSPEQRQAYIRKYLELHPNTPWRKVEEYEAHIKAIDGLEKLVETPFLLMIAMDVMPIIVEKYLGVQNEKERLKITRTALYDEFIENLFGEQSKKFESIALALEGGRNNIKEDYMYYSKKLAKAMYDNGRLFYVDYTPTSALQQSNLWEEFFGVYNPNGTEKERDNYRRLMVEARKGCPIRKIAANRWAFIHLSVQEYFYSKVYIKLTEKSAKKKANGSNFDRSLTQPSLSTTVKQPPQPLIFTNIHKASQSKSNHEVKEMKEKEESLQLLIEKASQMISQGDVKGLKALLSANPNINGGSCNKKGESLSSIVQPIQDVNIRNEIEQLLIVVDNEQDSKVDIWV